MAEICCGIVSESETSSSCEPSSRVARRKRMELRRFKVVTGVVQPEMEDEPQKRQKLEATSHAQGCDNAVESSVSGEKVKLKQKLIIENGKTLKKGGSLSSECLSQLSSTTSLAPESQPKFGVASVCGRRRDMEDAVAIHPSFCRQHQESTGGLHYFGVYDGHGCSHVAVRCRERLHQLLKEELENKGEEMPEWKSALGRSFTRMDKEVKAWNEEMIQANCRCELQTPECEAVGSTAVVAIVTPDKIIVANCGDSRAVLCRNGKPLPLSSDHKPDRPDELNRIQEAGGRVIYWDGPRVLGVLAMSRAIGDNYLKPYVTCEPEVTIIDRTDEDDCLILASDGLWDVVSNETACGVARMCLRGKVNGLTSSTTPESHPANWAGHSKDVLEISDKSCSDASLLLTKLALARHSTDNVSVVVVDLRRHVSRSGN